MSASRRREKRMRVPDKKGTAAAATAEAWSYESLFSFPCCGIGQFIPMQAKKQNALEGHRQRNGQNY